MYCLLFSGVVNILTFVENRKLCGNISLTSLTVKKNVLSMSKSASKPSTIENNVLQNSSFQSPVTDSRRFPLQNSDEIQIMCFITDLMCSIRKSIERNGLMGDELSALKTGFQIILGE